MAKPETKQAKQAPKSNLPILVGAIFAPLLVIVTKVVVQAAGWGGVNTNWSDLAFTLGFLGVLAIFGAIVGLISRRIVKSQWGAILLTLIVDFIVVLACFLPLIATGLLMFLSYSG